MERSRADQRLFWWVIGVILVADIITKRIAVEHLMPRRVPHEVIGDWLRWTLVYNPGAAFGLHLGPYSRWIFTALTLVALVILWQLFRQTTPGDKPRLLALALVTGGAVGNLLDRLRGAAGVVDFIDVGIGDMRWPTFNIADMAVSTGAFLLAWVLWGEDREAAAAAAAATPPPLSTGSSEAT